MTNTKKNIEERICFYTYAMFNNKYLVQFDNQYIVSCIFKIVQMKEGNESTVIATSHSPINVIRLDIIFQTSANPLNKFGAAY